MIYNTIQYVVDNGIGTLTFNRPTVANGFNIEMCKEILEVLDKAHNDESVRALLINAEGKVFSAGGDLTEMERAVNDGDTESLFEIVELVAQISMAMKRLPKPVIMSLQGAAAGAAFNMALAADFVVAANNVRFRERRSCSRCRWFVLVDSLHWYEPCYAYRYDWRSCFC